MVLLLISLKFDLIFLNSNNYILHFNLCLFLKKNILIKGRIVICCVKKKNKNINLLYRESVLKRKLCFNHDVLRAYCIESYNEKITLNSQGPGELYFSARRDDNGGPI